MCKIPQLKAIVALADHQSFLLAAGALGISQPTLTARVKAFESENGFHINLSRNRGTTFSLTPDGRELLPYARDVIKTVQKFEASVVDIKKASRGRTIRIGAGATASSYLLPQIVARFHTEHSDSVVQVLADKSEAIVRGVGSDLFDIGVVTDELGFDKERRASHYDNLEKRPWQADSYGVVCSTKHRFAKKKAFKWRDLEDERCWMLTNSEVKKLLEDRSIQENEKIVLRVVGEFPSIEAILRAVREGNGIGFITTSIWKVSQHEPSTCAGLHYIPCANGPIDRQLTLVRRKNKIRSEGQNDLWTFLLKSTPLSFPST